MTKVSELRNFPIIDLKLGIKSSMPKVKSTVALLLLLSTIFENTDSINYSKTNEEGEIVLSEEIFERILSKYEQLLSEEEIDSNQFREILNQNYLFTSQIEALIVTFELCYELARFSFEDSTLSYSAERTGGKRFPKIISYTSQIDYLNLIFSGDEIKYHRLLLNWIGFENISIDRDSELKLIKFLTLNSENSVYKLVYNEQDIVFNNFSIYEDLLNGNSSIDIKSDKESKGSLRILSNILKEDLNYYLKIHNGEVISNVSNVELESYRNRIEKYFELENKRLALSQVDFKLERESEEINNISDEEIKGRPYPYPLQQIHFGAPGTGKSYSLAQIIGESYEGYKDTDDNPYVFRTTVHNEYSYYDFVGNIMPKSEDGAIDYTFVPGIFTLALEKALTNPQNDIYLIIEEMSRGNIAAIFGDIFQLLDRDDEGVSEYRINNAMISDYINRVVDGERVNATVTLDKIYLPRNLHILGTANTSDQNVNVLDTAFKRRFGFVYQSVKPADKDGQLLNAYTLELSNRRFEWNEFYQKLNLFIVNSEKGLGLTEDKQLGQFFVKFKQPTADSTDEERHQIVTANFDAIRNKVLNYLWEDVQSVAMTEQKIFNHDLTAFSSLYELFDDKKRPTVKEIFSEEFMTFYDHEELG